MLSISTEHIAKTPGICGGKVCIVGHRIRVMDIVTLYEHGSLTPDEIADEYPGLTLADIHAALAYYHDHRSEIDAEFLREQQVAEAYRSHFPSKRGVTVGG